MQDILVDYVVELARKAAGDKPTLTAHDMMWALRKVMRNRSTLHYEIWEYC